jgi:secreted PhoX family phosphatase
MRYKPSINEGTPEENSEGVVSGGLQLFFESEDKSTFGLGDNLTVAPNGHLIICEDHYDSTIDHIRGITPEGGLYTLAKLNIESETAGVCFSPDGSTLFVNIQSPTKTLAITGPWDKFSS